MKIWICLASIALLAGCGTTTAVQTTGNEGEFVVTSIQNYGPVSSLDEAIAITVREATDFCSKKGMSYHRNYSIDHGMGIGQVVESTLYFSCIDPNQKKPTPDESDTAGEKSIADDLWKLDELRKSGALTEEEYHKAKSKLLGN